MPYRLIVVGASWGGLRATATLLEGLPSNFNTPIVAVQHRSATSDAGKLVDLMRSHTHLRVCEAEDKVPVEPGSLYIAPSDYHLLIDRDGLALSTDESVRYSRPSIDVLFESAADVYEAKLIGILLTGANSDGTRGLLAIKRKGGITIAEDPETAVSPVMPRSAIEAGAAKIVLPVGQISAFLADTCMEGREQEEAG